MKKVLILIVAYFVLSTHSIFANGDALTSNKLEILDKEIIITVTKDYDGGINADMEALEVVSLELIFNDNDLVMYLVKTASPVENIISKLRALSYISDAEYNQLGGFDDFHEQETIRTGIVGNEESKDLTRDLKWLYILAGMSVLGVLAVLTLIRR